VNNKLPKLQEDLMDLLHHREEVLEEEEEEEDKFQGSRP